MINHKGNIVKRSCGLAVPLVCLLLTPPVRAAQETSVAVMNLRTSSGVEEKMLAALTGVVGTNISITGEYAVMKTEEINDRLHTGSNLPPSDCGQLSCFLAWGKALGVSLLVTGTVNRSGETYTVNLQMTDIDRTIIKSTLTEEYTGDEVGLVEKMGVYTAVLLKGGQAEKVAVKDVPRPAVKKKAPAIASDSRPSTAVATERKTNRNRLFLCFDQGGPALAWERACNKNSSLILEAYGPVVRWSCPAAGIKGGYRKYFSPPARGLYLESLVSGGLTSRAYDDFDAGVSLKTGWQYKIKKLVADTDIGVAYCFSDQKVIPQLNIGVEIFCW
jgi:hypothetical protein